MTQEHNTKLQPTEEHFEIYDTENGYAFPWLDAGGRNGKINEKAARFSRSQIEQILSDKPYLLQRLGDGDRGVWVYQCWTNGQKRPLNKNNFEVAVKLESSSIAPGGAA